MKVSTKGRYGLRLMLCLALNYENGHMSLKEISKRQDISEKYLEQIINPLTKSKLVTSFRGAQGGYALALPPSKITVGCVLRILEGAFLPINCVDNKICDKATLRVSLNLWTKVKEAIDSVVDNITLEDLANEYREKTVIDYVI